MRIFLTEKCKIVTFGLKIFPENVFIQTTVYNLSVWCYEQGKQFVFQNFKNGWFLRTYGNLHLRKNLTDFEIRLKTQFKTNVNAS